MSRRVNIDKVQNVIPIWLDTSIDWNTEDGQQIQQSINNISTFSDTDECIEFIQTIQDNKICLIMPGYLGQYMIQHVHNLSQIDSIFIFCGNLKHHTQWTRNWLKIKGIFTEITSICQALKQAAQHCEQNSMSLSILSSNNRLDKLDPSFMYTQILRDIIINMDFDEQHIKQFVDYCRKIFADNKDELLNIDKFENEYTHHTPIWWYTYQCFLYPMLNRSLRLLDADIIIRMGFFIRDLFLHINELYEREFTSQSCPTTFTVYRGQGLTKVDFEQLSTTIGGLISFNNFLSTSKKREISFGFAQYAATNPDLVGILFIMEINPNQSTSPLASIRDVSYFQTEDEVLFSMHTVFRIREIKSVANKYPLYEVFLSLTNDNDDDLNDLTYSIRDEIPSCTNGWKPLALMLEKIGQFDKAEEIYRVVLEQTTYELGKGSLYHALGRIKYNQGKYLEAIDFHKTAIQLYQEHLSPTTSYLFEIYTNIGLAYGATGDYTTALDYFEQAISIRQESKSSEHPDVAYLLNNIGNIYYSLGDYSQAISYHEQALAIQQKVLPSNHPHLAMSYKDIALVYENLTDYSKAHSYFQLALDIAQQSLPSNHPELLKYQQQLEHIQLKL